MKKIVLTFFAITFCFSLTIAQNLTQTVRGKILDMDSKNPLTGATVKIVGSNPLIGTTTDLDGNFRLENIPVGRITLELSYIGYETKTFPNIEVNSGKEVVLQFEMQESILQMEEVVVKAQKNKGEALNEMALLSVHSISVEETKRYAGGFDDPSRVVSNLAGVTNRPDGSSDIIVRGNSPKYLQWRLEGIEISSPYHFDDQNASFGGLSALNNNLLRASDFYTGAFAAEYGNVLSSVMDVKLRPGNNEKFEGGVGLGILGTDITLEGPLKKGYAGSYLVNYRYSTAGLVFDLGLIDMDAVTSYQDFNTKFVLPTKNAGTFSLFAVAGKSKFIIDDLDPTILPTANNKTMSIDLKEDLSKENYLLSSGLNHVMTINENSFLKTSLSFSANGIDDEIYQSKVIRTLDAAGELIEDSLYGRRQNYDNNLMKSTYRGAITYHSKINARSKIQIGTKYSLFDYDYKQSMLNEGEDDMFAVIDFKENISTIQNFASWRYRLNEKLTLVTGLHNMNVLYNNKSTLEPRIAFNWELNKSNSIHAGYGNHSTMESIHHYFAKVQHADGSTTEPNQNLDLLKAHHYVIGYEKRFNNKLMAKIEAYYQDLYNLPVENNDTSYFATINEGIDYRYVDLVNKGTGKNYGVEITLERFFDGNFFFLVNTTLYKSKYKSLEGVERNTLYSKDYLSNILFGKEFHKLGKKKNQTLGLNCKMFFEGAQKQVPLLRDAEGNLAVDPGNNRFFDYSKAYESGLDDIFQLNLSISYKFNRSKTTHEIFLDLQNLTNNKGKLYEYYDETEPGSVGHITQFGFFPNLMYKVYF